MTFNQKNIPYCRKWDRYMVENYYEELKNPTIGVFLSGLFIISLIFYLIFEILSGKCTAKESLGLGFICLIFFSFFVIHFQSFTVTFDKITIRWLHFLKLSIPIENVRGIKFIYEGIYGFIFIICFKKPYFLPLGFVHYFPWGHEEDLAKLEEIISFFNARRDYFKGNGENDLQ